MPRHIQNAAVLSAAAFLCAGANRAVVADEAPSLFVNTHSGTVDCEGHDVNVTSSNAKLSFTGRCKGIYFVGTDTTATIESAELVQSSGNGMHVTVKGKVADAYLIGSRGEFAFDELGTLHLNGDELRVGAKTIGTMAVVGSRNTVHWSSGKPRIDDMGSGNVLQPKP